MSESPISKNPYASPASVTPIKAQSQLVQLTPRSNTILPRYLAASADLLGSFGLSVVVFKLLPDDAPLLQGLAPVAIWFGYFFLSEWSLSATRASG